MLASVASIVTITYFLTQRMERRYVSSARVLIKPAPAITHGTRILQEVTSLATYLEILKSRDMIESVVEKLREDESGLSIFAFPDPVWKLSTRITARSIRPANIIVITVTDVTPRGAMVMANAVSQSFAMESADLARARVMEKKRFIEASLPLARESLDEAESALKEFKLKHHIISGAGGTTIEKHVADLSAEKKRILAEIRMKEESLVALKKEIEKQNEALGVSLASIEDVPLSLLRDDLFRLSQEKRLYLQAGLSPTHARIVEIEDKMERIRTEIEERVRGRKGDALLIVDPLEMIKDISKKIVDIEFELLELGTKLKVTDEMLDEYRKELEKFPEKEFELAALERAYEFSAGLSTTLLEKYEEARFAEVSEVGDIVVIEEARLPTAPVFPNVRRNILFAIVFGLGLGIAGVILAEYADTTVREVSEIEKQLSMPAIGVVPLYRGGLISDDMKEKSILETFKRIRTNLKFLTVDGGSPKTVLITSTLEDEGKTLLTANLGVVLAGGGKRVLIVDGDMRKSTIHRLFGMNSKPGLTDLLIGDVGLDEVVRETSVENLFILPAGSVSPSPPELLDSDRMKKIVGEIKLSYDNILIDSAPVLFCTDSLILASMTDGVILVVQMRGPRRERIISAIGSLRDVEANILACILNKAAKSDYYGSYHYYHGYGYGERGA